MSRAKGAGLAVTVHIAEVSYPVTEIKESNLIVITSRLAKIRAKIRAHFSVVNRTA